MATRVECKFCGEKVKVTKTGRLLTHGYKRDMNGIARLDNVCAGSRKYFVGAAKGPVNHVEPCTKCGIPVIVAQNTDPKKVLCVACLS